MFLPGLLAYSWMPQRGFCISSCRSLGLQYIGLKKGVRYTVEYERSVQRGIGQAGDNLSIVRCQNTRSITIVRIKPPLLF
jgi:hypothetical protein